MSSAATTRDQRASQWVRSTILTPVRWDARVLWAAAVAGLSAASALGLAWGVRERSDLSSYDPSVTASVVADRSRALTVLAQVLTFVGSEVAIGALTVVVLAWLVLRHRAWRTAVLFGSTMAVGSAVTLVVKHVMSRTRPPASVMLGPVDTGFSFPSGHTTYSTVFFGLVAGVLVMRWTRTSVRALVALAWVLASGAVGLSRLYLGYHWLTDVMAGWSIGIAVLALAAAVVLLTRPRPEVRDTIPA
jgi:membrane-associated phospholipid phosphatase